MKQKFLSAILCLGLLTAYFACEKDDVSTFSDSQTEAVDNNLQQGNPQRGISIQTIGFNAAPHKDQLIDKLTAMAPQGQDGMVSFNDSSGNSLLDGLNIEQDSVAFASFGNKHSYTFATWRDHTSALVENLVLTYDNESEGDNDYTAYLMQYDF